MKHRLVAAAGAALLVCGLAAGAQAQQQPTRSITQVEGDLYRAQNNQHFTVFLVTSEGIILSDPINRDFSEWLRAELDERFGVPVRYVLYSHHHWDHASGGEVFADTADFVGHYSMAEALALPPADTPIPPQFADMDANGDGVIERSEAAGQLANQFDLYDFDGDGVLTGAELARGPVSDVHPPNIYFSDEISVSLGGSSAEVIHVGPAHSPDMSVVRFPEQSAVFLVDFMSVRRLPFGELAGVDLDELLGAIRRVEAMDFDIAVPGHGEVGTRADAAAYREYLEELRDTVAEGIAAGQSLEQLQQSLAMDAYSDWGNYDNWLPMNVAGMYRILSESD